MWGALAGWGAGGWVAAGALAALSAALAACVCGCRNNQQKSELVGTAGVLKIRFDEEAPSPTPTTPASVKRASTQNSQRSLPEIPHPVGRHDSGDTASEIYATVNLDEGASKEEPAQSTSREHSYEHAYAKLQNESHMHIEISPEQQPFTNSVGDEPTGAREVPSQSALESVVISASVAISGQLPSSQELPYITPPSPLPHPEPNPQHFSGDSTDSAKGYTSISVREPLSNIRAIIQNKSQPQQHYATVSDDSDEMYAAIDEPNGSESGGGGSDTYAQIAPQEARQPAPTPELRRPAPEPRPPPAERHSQERERAALLPSDAGSRRSAPPDSAAEAAPNHSRQASASSCSNSVGNLGSPKPEKRQANSPLPPPPPPPPGTSTHTLASLDGAKADRKKQDSPHNHTNISSRQQRISSTGDLHFIHDKHRRSLNEKHQRNNSCVSSSDFYGCNYPVEKHRFSSSDLVRPLVAKELNFDIDKPAEGRDNTGRSDGPRSGDYPTAEADASSAAERTSDSPSRNVEAMYAKVMKKAKSKLHPEEVKSSRKLAYGGDSSNHNTSQEQETLNASRFSTDDPGYETIDRKRSVNHGYETITEKVRKISQSQDPGYETVRDVKKMSLNANFSNNNLMNKPDQAIDSGPNSILSSDPGYEHISKTDNFASDSDPNYEALRNLPATPPYATIAPNYNAQPTYSVINKNPAKHDWTANNNDDATLEPNYESMPHDPIYTTGSESDPNYESVRPKDPNYETVNQKDPNYESLRLKDQNYESFRSKSKDPNYESVAADDPNYESVRYKEPPNERVQSDTQVERSDSVAGYEKIKTVTNKSSINGEGGSVSDYFQV